MNMDHKNTHYKNTHYKNTHYKNTVQADPAPRDRQPVEAGKEPPVTGLNRERGSGTVLTAGLAMVVLLAAAVVMLLAQSAVHASRAASAADLSALAGADALRGITSGEPCVVAADVAARHSATVVSCVEGPGQTIEIRTELRERPILGPMVGAATGHARAGPPP